MVIWPAFRMGQYSVNDHPYHAPQFRNLSYYLFKKGLSWEHKKKTTTEKPKEKNPKTESDEPVDKKGLSKAAIAMILMLVFCI